jgi:hypothetical protein
MRKRLALALTFALGITACGREPVAPVPTPSDAAPLAQKGHVEGTGLVLENIAGLPLGLGDIVIRQAAIKEFGFVEDVAGNIVGLEATGALELTGGVLGTTVVTDEFTTGVGVISSSGGQCDIVTVNLAPMTVDVLGGAVAVDLPVTEVGGRGNGAVGSLLCAVGQIAQPLVNGVAGGIRGLVNALNRLLI